MSTEVPSCYYRVSTKALIFDENKRLFLIKTDDGSRGFPGGGLEFGENPQDCLSREIKEELGFTPISVSNQPNCLFPFKNIRGTWMINIFYEVKINKSDLNNFVPSEECVEWGFFSIEEASKLYKRPILRLYLEHINNN